MNKKVFAAPFIGAVLCMLPLLFLFAHNSLLPEYMPIHWNLNGRADGFASNYVVLLIMPLLYLLLHVTLHFFINHFPAAANARSTPEFIRKYGKWLAPTLSILQISLSISHAIAQKEGLHYRVIDTWLGLFAIISADYILHNNWYGRIFAFVFDLSQTRISYPEINRQLHKMWTICGLLLIACSYLMMNSAALILLICIGLMPVIVIWYNLNSNQKRLYK